MANSPNRIEVNKQLENDLKELRDPISKAAYKSGDNIAQCTCNIIYLADSWELLEDGCIECGSTTTRKTLNQLKRKLDFRHTHAHTIKSPPTQTIHRTTSATPPVQQTWNRATNTRSDGTWSYVVIFFFIALVLFFVFKSPKDETLLESTNIRGEDKQKIKEHTQTKQPGSPTSNESDLRQEGQVQQTGVVAAKRYKAIRQHNERELQIELAKRNLSTTRRQHLRSKYLDCFVAVDESFFRQHPERDPSNKNDYIKRHESALRNEWKSIFRNEPKCKPYQQ